MSESNNDARWVGFDLGGTKMLAKVFDADFNSLGRERKKTKGHEGAETGLERIVRTIRQALEDAEVSADQLAGIGLGTAGPLDLDRGILFDAPNLGWSEVPLKETIENEFQCPAVVGNDVDLGVYGEYACGSAQGARCVVGVFPGTGIGGGCVYEGKILRGKSSSCMEIGHIQVMPSGPRCGCGASGCLEAVASRSVIAAAAALAAQRGQAPHLLKIAGVDLANIRSGALAESIEAGDTVVEEIVQTAAEKIGMAVASVVHLLAPDMIVLGGGLVEAIPKRISKTVARTANQHVLPSYADSFKVVEAELGDDAVVLGAAAWARAVVTENGLN